MTQVLGETSKQRWERLKLALRAEGGRQSTSLLDKMERCHDDWQGRYTCRTTSCPRCRRTYSRSEQRLALDAFADCENEDLLFVTVVTDGVRDVEQIGPTLTKARDDLRNRLRAEGLNHLRVKAWHEIDAVGSDQFPLLPPARLRLLSAIAPMSVDQVGPTWCPSFHALVDRRDVAAEKIGRALARQWPVQGQVDVRPFKPNRLVDANIHRTVSYSTKFSSLTALRSDRRGGAFLDRWPISWDVALHGWLHSLSTRKAFEVMKFSLGMRPHSQKVSLSEAESPSDEGFPFAYAVTGVPMSYNTSWHRVG